MSFSYNPDALDIELNRIRLEISDTNSVDYLLQDEEIATVQSEQPSFYVRVAKCCELIAASFARKAKVRIDGFSEDPSGMYEKYAALAAKYSGSYPWTGSIYQADKDAVKADDSYATPKFRLGMHDYP